MYKGCISNQRKTCRHLYWDVKVHCDEGYLFWWKSKALNFQVFLVLRLTKKIVFPLNTQTAMNNLMANNKHISLGLIHL